MSKKSKSMPIQSWRSTDPQLINQKFEPSYVVVVQPFESLKQGWVIQYGNDYWRIISLHTNNILKIRKLSNPKSKIIYLENVNEVNVRFIRKQPRITKKHDNKQSITMDFDKLYGKTWSISGGLPSLGKKK